jgi:hypothetical protein
MTKIIASLVLAASVLAGIGAAQAGPFDDKGSYVAPGGLYTPFAK